MAGVLNDYYKARYVEPKTTNGTYAEYAKAKLESEAGVETSKGKLTLSGGTVTYTPKGAEEATVTGTFDEETGVVKIGGETTGEIKGEKSDGPKIKIDGTEIILTKENFGNYLGKKVTNYTGQSTVTIGSSTYNVSPTYRLYYVDFDNKYGNEAGTVYLKAECTTNNTALGLDTSSADDSNIKIKQLNPHLYKNDEGTEITPPDASNINMKAVTWLTNTTNWASLADFSMSSKINYIVGSPSLEMMMDSYNAHYGLTGESPYTGSLSSTSDRVKLFYQYTSGECGYMVGPSNISSASNGYWTFTSEYSVKTDSSIDTMYYPGSSKYYWLASPSADDSNNVMNVGSYRDGRVHDYSYDDIDALCPLVSLKSDVLLELQ